MGAMWAILVCGIALLLVVWYWRRSGRPLGEFLGLGVVWVYGRLWKGCWSRGVLPLPTKGAAILVSNHTCSADAAFLTTWSDRVLSFLMAREYYDDIPFLRGLFDSIGCVLVKRDGEDVCTVRHGLRRLAEGRVLCIFPEGGLHYAGRDRVFRGKAGVALLALRSRAPVFPVFISGGPRHANVPRAWLHPSRAQLHAGPAIDLSAYYERRINRALLEEVATYIMHQVAALGPRPTAE